VTLAPSVIVASDPRLDLLEMRLERLEGREETSARAAASEGAEANTPSAATSQSTAESKRYHEELHTKAIAEAKAEPIDRAWASSTEATVQTDLGTVAAASASRGMSVVGVECRTNHCLATLQWPSFTAASAGYFGVLHGRLQVNCAREILLPEPADVTATYEATAVFDCSESRGGNERR
jgi:hypothetical protein